MSSGCAYRAPLFSMLKGKMTRRRLNLIDRSIPSPSVGGFVKILINSHQFLSPNSAASVPHETARREDGNQRSGKVRVRRIGLAPAICVLDEGGLAGAHVPGQHLRAIPRHFRGNSRGEKREEGRRWVLRVLGFQRRWQWHDASVFASKFRDDKDSIWRPAAGASNSPEIHLVSVT